MNKSRQETPGVIKQVQDIKTTDVQSGPLEILKGQFVEKQLRWGIARGLSGLSPWRFGEQNLMLYALALERCVVCTTVGRIKIRDLFAWSKTMCPTPLCRTRRGEGQHWTYLSQTPGLFHLQGGVPAGAVVAEGPGAWFMSTSLKVMAQCLAHRPLGLEATLQSC